MTLRKSVAGTTCAAILGGLLIFGPKPKVQLNLSWPVAHLTGDIAQLENNLKLRDDADEVQDQDLRSKIIWAAGKNHKTERVLLFLHGFSASPLEYSPVLERLAHELNANLMLYRLTGHGKGKTELGAAKAQSWFQDTADAFSVAETLGTHIDVVGSSTGATLAVWSALANPTLPISKMVLFSPNFAVHDVRARLVFFPWFMTIQRAMAGDWLEWSPKNELMKRRWTYRYRLEVVPELLNMIDAVASMPIEKISVPTLALISPCDDVINESAAIKNMKRVPAPWLQLNEFDHCVHHVMAGDASSPETTDEITAKVLAFLR